MIGSTDKYVYTEITIYSFGVILYEGNTFLNMGVIGDITGTRG